MMHPISRRRFLTKWTSPPLVGPTRNKKIVLILTTISKLYTHIPYEKTQYKKIKWDQTGPLCRKKSPRYLLSVEVDPAEYVDPAKKSTFFRYFSEIYSSKNNIHLKSLDLFCWIDLFSQTESWNWRSSGSVRSQQHTIPLYVQYSAVILN